MRSRALLLFALITETVALAVAQELVLHKEGTDVYHRPACAVIRDGDGVLAMSRGQAEARGLKPHADCDPAKQPQPRAVAPTPRTPGSSPASVAVWVDGGRYYHREGCKQLGKGTRKMALDEAAKARWPCTKCCPPIRKRRQ
jgi:hypothetical protein